MNYALEHLFKALDTFGKIEDGNNQHEKSYYPAVIGGKSYWTFGKYCFGKYYACKKYILSRITFRGNEDYIELLFGKEFPSEIMHMNYSTGRISTVDSTGKESAGFDLEPKVLNNISEWLYLTMAEEI